MNSLEELLDFNSPQKLIAKKSNIRIDNFLKFQKVHSQTHEIYTEPRSVSTLLEQTPAPSPGSQFSVIWRNGVGMSNFPRFPRTSFTCTCLRPQSIKIRADLVFVISYCQSYESGRIFLFMG